MERRRNGARVSELSHKVCPRTRPAGFGLQGIDTTEGVLGLVQVRPLRATSRKALGSEVNHLNLCRKAKGFEWSASDGEEAGSGVLASDIRERQRSTRFGSTLHEVREGPRGVSILGTEKVPVERCVRSFTTEAGDSE